MLNFRAIRMHIIVKKTTPISMLREVKLDALSRQLALSATVADRSHLLAKLQCITNPFPSSPLILIKNCLRASNLCALRA